MSMSTDLVRLYGGAEEMIVALQLNWPPWAVRRGLNVILLVRFVADMITLPTVIPLPLDTIPLESYHCTLIGLVKPTGNVTVQKILYCCPAMASPSVMEVTCTSSMGTRRINLLD